MVLEEQRSILLNHITLTTTDNTGLCIDQLIFANDLPNFIKKALHKCVIVCCVDDRGTSPDSLKLLPESFYGNIKKDRIINSFRQNLEEMQIKQSLQISTRPRC